jgi:hypothetical protein
LDPAEVVRRVRAVFVLVEADRAAGARHVDDMIAAFQRMNASERVVEAHRQMRDDTIALFITDNPTSEVAYLKFAAMPEQGLLIGYHSRQHEDAARPLLERCAEALGYEIVAL